MNDERRIRVTGTGLLRLKSDLCRVNLTLRGLEPAYSDALNRASRDSAALVEAIAALGFTREDLKTLDFSVDAEYESVQDDKGHWRQEFKGYRFTQALKLEFPVDNVLLGRTLAASVEYMLDKYPALDPSRVYATGYSKGGGSTVNVGTRRADLFAALMPMAAGGGYIGTDEEIALLNEIGMPIMMFTSRYDVGFNGTIVAGYQATINRFLGYNHLATVDNFDFDTYPISGFAGDIYRNFTVNGEKEVMQWQFCNEDGVPLVGYNFTEENIHALYPGYGYIAWEFAKHYSRNQETGAIEYNK